ncbi:hypothetical protein NPIL_476731 [Nephila pilipes]|uniref:Uncharacterized protein n=1 Tax=Nephila pilipes TaxID=299642 RepID=A0A8X6QV02_NEPPI|nr:hypothetical protein NPIL_476731 [Nephila pilipes]
MAKVWKNRATSIIFTIGFFVTDLALGYMDASSCFELDFPCNNGDCIDAALWCDSHEDCSDGSDEAYCKKITFYYKNPNKCSKDFFKCDDGPCIPLRGRCNGYQSCSDNSDEKNCMY